MKTNNIFLFVLLIFGGSLSHLFAIPSLGSFQSITVANGLNNNTVYDIMKDQQGFLWFSTDMGISRYDGYHIRNFPFLSNAEAENKSAFLLPHAISNVEGGTDVLLYLLLLRGGIVCFDKVRESYLPVDFDRPFDPKKINSVYVVDNQSAYLATSDGLYGVEVKRQERGGSEIVRMILTEEPLVKGNVSQLCGNKEGHLFFCLGDKDVICYSMGTRQQKNISSQINFTAPISKLYVQKDYLWICSKRAELGCYNYRRGIYRMLTDASPEKRTILSDTYILDITAGTEATYYLSTGVGVCCLTFSEPAPITASYTFESLAQKDDFNYLPIENKTTGLIYDSNYQILWIGTVGGGVIRMTCGKEMDLSGQKKKQLILSDLWVNGKPVQPGTDIIGEAALPSTSKYQEPFQFSGENNEICFYFTDFQYGLSSQKINYRLLPNEEWISSSLDNGIRLSRLKAGEYTLQVKPITESKNDENVLELTIVVQKFWWMTAWAICFYIIIVCVLIGGLFYFLLKRAKKKLLSSYNEERINIVNPSENLPVQNEIVVASQHDQNSENNQDEEVKNLVFARFMQELRTPLSLIISPLREVLQEKELSRGLSTKILVAYRNSIGMLNSCDQLLNIYTYSSAKEKIELAPYSLLKVTDTFVFSLNEFLRVHSIGFQYEKKISKELEVWIDKKAINLILQNLLTNAFIHVNYSGAVALILQEVVENDLTYCTISVVDNGKAQVRTVEELSKELQLLLTMEPAEVELGYAVMQDIMKRHHGSISLENLRGGGTKVQIKWPINKIEFEQDENVVFIDPEKMDEVTQLESQPDVNIDELEANDILEVEGAAPVERTKKTVLVIEDYKDIRLYLKTLFEKDYNVLLAVNGEEGVSLARKELPDLIICDVMMPIKDGFECCRELKNGLDTCHIPFVLLTAKVEDDDIIKGLEIGADDYILKPFVAKILKVKVKNLIEGRINLKNTYTKLLVTPTEDVSNGTGEKEAEIQDPFISTVVRIIEENILEPDFNVKKLASDLNMSQPTLYRKVKQCTDFTIIELIRGVRMRRAATLLKKKQYPVQEVAEMVGYNDIPTFRKHFVDTYGVTPSTYADSNVSANN